MLSRQELILKFVLAAPLLIPGAYLLMTAIVVVATAIATLGLGTDLMEWDVPIYVVILMALGSWTGLLYWSTATDSSRRTVARTFWAFCAGAFLLPVVGILSAILWPDPPGGQAVVTKAWTVILTVGIGLPLGFLCFLIARTVAPQGSPESTGGIWYVFRPIGGGWFVLAVGLLLTGAVVLRIAGYEGLLH